MQRAPSNRSILRITVATAVAVLMSTTLVACERDGDTATTTAGVGEPEAGERAGERPGEALPGAQQDTTQQGMGQGQQATGQGQAGAGQDQPGMGQDQRGMGQDTQGTQAGTEGIMARAESCPMMIENTNLDVENTADGVAMRFVTTSAANVDDLRKRVETMARMYEAHSGEQGQAGMMWHRMGHTRADQDQPGAASQGQARGAAMPAITTRVEKIQNGAMLVLTPKEKAQLDTLREHVREHERRMDSGECWMMEAQQTGQDQAGEERQPDQPSSVRPKT